MNLHGRIMNIPAPELENDPAANSAFKRGHRDARHAAAEMAVKADARIDELESFIRACLDCTSADEVHDFLVNNADKILAEEEE